MLFGKLFHVGLRTADLGASVRFYTAVLAMIPVARPPLPFPGAWLAPAQAGAAATIAKPSSTVCDIGFSQ